MSAPPDRRGPRDARGGSTPRRWIRYARLRGLREAGIVLIGFALFTLVHAAVGKDAATATANAVAIQSVERALHVNIERAANGWLAGHPALIPPAVYCYRLYYAVILGVLVWVFVRHRDVYVKVRRTMLTMAAFALVVFWALPVSPPRFAQPGIVDIVADHDILASHVSRDVGSGQLSFSAMPSLHVGWSAWCGYAVWSALRAGHPRPALAAWALPLVMAVVVLTTGNHYVLDIAGSAVLLGVSIAAVSVWGRYTTRETADRWN